MYFPCDEASVFDLQTIPGREWRHAVVGGVLIDYRARRWWLENYSSYPKKGQNYSHGQMISVLQSLVKLGVIGKCHVVHLTVDPDKAKQCQTDMILPNFKQAANQPKHFQDLIYAHLEILEKMKPQTFAKTWTLMEVIAEGVSSYLNCVGRKRSQDQRGLNIIIDDQVEQMLPTLKDFIWYFLNCRAVDGIFSFSAGVPKSMEKYIQSIKQGKIMDLTPVIKIVVGKQGEKLDDKFIELRLADVISNFMNRRFKGELPDDVCNILNKIVGDVRTVYFGETLEHHVTIPELARAGFASLDLTS